MKTLAKATARSLAKLLVVPIVLSYFGRSYLLGRDRAFTASTQMLALVPGLVGQYLRRAFLASTIRACHATAAIEWGTVFSDPGARIDENVYIGPGCHIGLVHVERDVLIAAGVHIPSGRHTHGVASLSIPIREQPGAKTLIRVGRGSWIGSNAVIMADVGSDAIVGAGAVVSTPVPDRVVAAGVPARALQRREAVKEVCHV